MVRRPLWGKFNWGRKWDFPPRAMKCLEYIWGIATWCFKLSSGFTAMANPKRLKEVELAAVYIQWLLPPHWIVVLEESNQGKHASSPTSDWNLCLDPSAPRSPYPLPKNCALHDFCQLGWPPGDHHFSNKSEGEVQLIPLLWMDTEHLVESSNFCQWWVQTSIWTRTFIFLYSSLKPCISGGRVISPHLGCNWYPVSYKNLSILRYLLDFSYLVTFQTASLFLDCYSSSR